MDPVRAVATVKGARVVWFCAPCQSGQALQTAEPAVCPEPAALGAPKDAGRATTERPPPPQSRRFGMRVALVLALVVATPLGARAFQQRGGEELLVSAPLVIAERPTSELLSLQIGPMELVEPAATILAEGEGWVHPVAGTEEQVPLKRTRLFRAKRPGNRSKECGGGHCGVDLDAPRGTPVVAIRDGIIEKVVRDVNAKGGRYIWLFHEDIGLRTEYFHFDKIAPDMEAGKVVQAGQWLGTLGRSGIEHAEPHLHFTVRDVNRGLRYVDPKPWLAKAEILPLLDLRLAAAE